MEYQFMKNPPEASEMISTQFIIGLEDGIRMLIPNDLANRHWQAYQEWLALGNEPLEAD